MDGRRKRNGKTGRTFPTGATAAPMLVTLGVYFIKRIIWKQKTAETETICIETKNCSDEKLHHNVRHDLTADLFQRDMRR